MDERIREVFGRYLTETLEHIIISNSRQPELMTKVRIRPVELSGEILFQETRYIGTKVFHSNKNAEELLAGAEEYFEGLFGQAELKKDGAQATILLSKKGTVTIKEKRTAATGAFAPMAHNTGKKYIIEEGTKVPFMVDLGVMTESGKIITKKYDKFRQINRYLEFIDDIVPALPKDRAIRIIDFGCGKSYLTFAMYYFLHELRGLCVEVTGLDLKDDVIKKCNELRDRYGYEGLRFLHGDIADYECDGKVDMIVTLHACDTATDYALANAVKWGAEVILCVPCCQHEINKQIKSESLKSVLKYGLIKERMSALITDAVRANTLEEHGYRTQILEFIDMEHTPKNILIRAVRQGGAKMKTDTGCERLLSELHSEQTLRRLLEGEK